MSRTPSPTGVRDVEDAVPYRSAGRRGRRPLQFASQRYHPLQEVRDVEDAIPYILLREDAVPYRSVGWRGHHPLHLSFQCHILIKLSDK